jgi:AcrR family transcriptional regulator
MPEPIILIQNGQPTRADALKNRAILLETAMRLFAEHSVDEVSMSAIAEAAGLGKGTLYRHFQNKNELCEALLDQDQRDLQARTLDQLRQVSDPREKLRWFLRAVINFAEQHSALFYAVSGAELLVHPAHWWWRQTIRALLVQMKITGDVDYLTDMLYGQVSVVSLQYMRQIRGYSIERILDGLYHLIDHLASSR